MPFPTRPLSSTSPTEYRPLPLALSWPRLRVIGQYKPNATSTEYGARGIDSAEQQLSTSSTQHCTPYSVRSTKHSFRVGCTVWHDRRTDPKRAPRANPSPCQLPTCPRPTASPHLLIHAAASRAACGSWLRLSVYMDPLLLLRMTCGSQLASASILPIWLRNLGWRSCVERGMEQYRGRDLESEIALQIAVEGRDLR